MSDSHPTAEHLPAWLVRRPVPILILICLLAWLPGALSLPPLDRDESRFAQASKQMIETGDYVDLRFTTVPRYNKPVGIYWAQAAASQLLGHPPYNQIWTYRLPSLIGGILAVLLTYWCARGFASREIAFVSAALLGLTVALSAEAEIATTDALLLATIVAAQGLLMRLYIRARERPEGAPSLTVTLGAWAAVGAGILLKGPVILGVLGLSVTVLSLWDRDWHWLRGSRIFPGALVLLTLVLPWALAIALATHGAFYQRSLGHDFAAKLLGGQESHGAPPGYYLALAAVTLWPATLFLVPAIGRAVRQRTELATRFLLAWAVPNWLMFELVPTKLPHYILPVYPAICMLTAVWLTAPRDPQKDRSRPVLRLIGAIAFAGVGLGFAAALVWAANRFGSGPTAVPVVSALAVAALVISAGVLQLLRKDVRAFLAAIGAALLLYPMASAAVAPHLGQLWVSRSIADRVTHDRAPSDPAPVLAGYVEPSTVFLLGTKTHLESGKGAGLLAAHQEGLALIEDQQRAQFLQALHTAGGSERAVDQIFGFNYSRGRQEHVTVYRVAPAGR